MFARRPEQNLRRLVAEIAETRAEDVDAILAELDPAHATRVRELLAEYEGATQAPSKAPAPKRDVVRPEPPPTPPPPPPQEMAADEADDQPRVVSDLEGLSSWLAVRLRRSAENISAGEPVTPFVDLMTPIGRAIAGQFSMTAHALKALQRAAVSLQPMRPDDLAPSSQESGLRLPSSLWRMLSRRSSPRATHVAN